MCAESSVSWVIIKLPPILLDGLSKLEYRGYDSAGLADRDGQEMAEVVKAKGRLKVLSEKTDGGKAVSVPAVSGTLVGQHMVSLVKEMHIRMFQVIAPVLVQEQLKA